VLHLHGTSHFQEEYGRGVYESIRVRDGWPAVCFAYVDGPWGLQRKWYFYPPQQTRSITALMPKRWRVSSLVGQAASPGQQ
jgi:hypothetical protein